MTVTASLKRRAPTINIKVADDGRIETSTPVTIQQSISSNRLDTLQDVVASNEMNGAVPVYDSTQDKYVIKKLDIADVSGDLDGGTF